jgi:hypothetical protein
VSFISLIALSVIEVCHYGKLVSPILLHGVGPHQECLPSGLLTKKKSFITLAPECPNQTKAEEVYWNFGEDILSRFVEEPWKFGCPSK